MAVEFTSYGYDTAPGEGLGELVWQEMFPQIGSATYGVRSSDDWKVTAVSGADRTVSIAAGRGWGLGVIDKTVANDTIQLDPITSGSRWDLIAVRRDPTPTKGVTEFVKINGGSTQVIPGGRLSGPGIHDQPLALVQVTAGQTQPTVIIDLRCWATNGGMVAKSTLALGYLNQLGTCVYIDGVMWRRVPGLNNIPEWDNGAFFELSPLAVAAYSITGKVYREPAGTANQRITVDLTFTRTGADLPLETASWTPLATPPLPESVRGTGLTKYVPVALIGAGNNIDIFAALNPATGSLQLRAIENDHLLKKGAQFCLNLTYFI